MKREYFEKCAKAFCDLFRGETNASDFSLSIEKENRLRGAVSFTYDNLERVKTALFTLSIQGIIPGIHPSKTTEINVYSQYYKEENNTYRIWCFIYSENVEGLYELVAP